MYCISFIQWLYTHFLLQYHSFIIFDSMAVVAEWLRRLTRNQIPSGSVGSNPTGCVKEFYRNTLAMGSSILDKNYRNWARLCLWWLGGLGVWFALRVREVPGSIPGQALLFWIWAILLLMYFKLEVQFPQKFEFSIALPKESKTSMERWGIEPQAFRMRSGRSTTELLPQVCKPVIHWQCISYALFETCQNCGKAFDKSRGFELGPYQYTM